MIVSFKNVSKALLAMYQSGLFHMKSFHNNANITGAFRTSVDSHATAAEMQTNSTGVSSPVPVDQVVMENSNHSENVEPEKDV